VIALVFGGLSIVLEKNVAGTDGVAWAFSPLQRFLIAGNAFWFYVWKALVPYPVYQVYYRWPIDAGKPVNAAWLYIGPAMFVAVLAALMALWKKLPRGPLAVMLLFAGALFPTLGFISFYTMLFSFVADHYQYLAIPIVLVFAVEALVWSAGKVIAWLGVSGDVAGIRQGVIGTAGAVILAAMSLYAYGVSALYRDGVLLWGYAFDHNPNSSFVCTQYSAAWLMARPVTEENISNAALLIETAIRLAPDSWRPYDAKSRLMEGLGEHEKAAIYQHEAERRMSPQELLLRDYYLSKGAQDATAGIARTPEWLKANAFEQQEKWDEAIAAYTQDVTKHPQDWDGWLKLGYCYLVGKGDPAKAVEIYRKVITEKPDYADAWLYLGYGLRAQGKEQEGIDALKNIEKYGKPEEVLRRHPEFLAPRKN